MELLLYAVIAVALVTAGAVVALLRRRLVSSSDHARDTAPELSADEVSWRIGASSARREAEPEPGTDSVTAAEPDLAGTSAAGLVAMAAPRAPDSDPAAVPTEPAFVDARVHSGQSEPVVSTRRQLLRDSATVLLAACLVVLAVTALAPPQAPGPAEAPFNAPTEVTVPSGAPASAPTASTQTAPAPSGPLPELTPGPSEATTAAPTDGGVAAETSPPTAGPAATRNPGASAAPTPAPTRPPGPTPGPTRSPGPTSTPGTPTPTPLVPTPTPVPPTPTPDPTPDPTPIPTPDPTPIPTPDPTPEPIPST